jgi:hypothetical protein
MILQKVPNVGLGQGGVHTVPREHALAGAAVCTSGQKHGKNRLTRPTTASVVLVLVLVLVITFTIAVWLSVWLSVWDEVVDEFARAVQGQGALPQVIKRDRGP